MAKAETLKSLISMMNLGNIIVENMENKAEADLQHSMNQQKLKLEERRLDLTEEKYQNDHNFKLEAEYDSEFLEDLNGDGYKELKPGTTFADSNSTKTAVYASKLQTIQNYEIKNPSISPFLEGVDPGDAKSLIADWETYKNFGTNYENGTIINEDLYRKWDKSYGGLGKLWAVDLDSSGYLGYNDKAQAENWFNTVVEYATETDDIMFGTIDAEDAEVLREWGVLKNNEDFDPAGNNQELYKNVVLRTNAFFSGLNENENLMTERAHQDYLLGEDVKNIQFSDAILGSVSVSQLKDQYTALYTNIQTGIINKDGYVIGAVDSLRDLDILQESSQRKWTKATNEATTNFLVSLRTGGEGYGHLKRFADDISQDGRPVANSEFHQVYAGLMTAGLESQAKNLLLSVQSYGKYNDYIQTGSAYVQGSVEDPFKMTSRALMVGAIDEKDNTGLSLRDKLFQAAQTNNQGEVDKVLQNISVAFKELRMQGQEIPFELRKEWMDLLNTQLNAYMQL